MLRDELAAMVAENVRLTVHSVVLATDPETGDAPATARIGLDAAAVAILLQGGLDFI